MSNLEIILFAIYVMSTLAVLFHYTDNSRDSATYEIMGPSYLVISLFVSLCPILNTLVVIRLIWDYFHRDQINAEINEQNKREYEEYKKYNEKQARDAYRRFLFGKRMSYLFKHKSRGRS